MDVGKNTDGKGRSGDVSDGRKEQYVPEVEGNPFGICSFSSVLWKAELTAESDI